MPNEIAQLFIRKTPNKLKQKTLEILLGVLDPADIYDTSIIASVFAQNLGDLDRAGRRLSRWEKERLFNKWLQDCNR